MPGWLDRWTRVIGTGASFALFGIGGLLLGTVGLGVIALGSANRERRQRRFQLAIHRSFRFFVGFMRGVGVVELQVRNPERLSGSGPRLVVANHPTLLDYVLIASKLPQLDCVVKPGVWNNPAMAGVVRGAGFVPSDGGKAILDGCAERLRTGRNLLIFPEGTRSPKAGLGRFQRGAAHVAIGTGVPILPVTITCVPPGLMRGQPWWDVPERRMQITLDVGSPIHPPQSQESRALQARSLTNELREHFEKGLRGVHDSTDAERWEPAHA